MRVRKKVGSEALMSFDTGNDDIENSKYTKTVPNNTATTLRGPFQGNFWKNSSTHILLI